MAKRKKKSHFIRNSLVLLGLFSLGIFTITGFAKIWGFLIENSNTVLMVTGGIILGLIIIGVFSPKKVKKSLFGSFRRLMA